MGLYRKTRGLSSRSKHMFTYSPFAKGRVTDWWILQRNKARRAVEDAVLPPLVSSIIQWIVGTNDEGDGLTDSISPLIVTPEPNLVDVAIVEMDGVGDKLLVPGLTTDDVITLQSLDDIPVGDDQVVNGTFDTDTDWIKQTGWSIANGKATRVGTTGYLKQDGTIIGLVLGETYRVKFDVVENAGTGGIKASPGISAVSSYHTDVGSYVEVITCAGNTSLYMQAQAGFLGSIDNIVVELYDGTGYSSPAAGTDEITFTAGIAWGVKINGVMTYPLREDDGAVAGDVSGNGNDGTLEPTEGPGDAVGIASMRVRSDVASCRNALLGFNKDGDAFLPSLTEDTISAATFDGTDYLTVIGLDSSDVVTVDNAPDFIDGNPSSELVRANMYDADAAIGTADLGFESTTRDYISYSQKSRIRQAGTLEKVKLFVDSTIADITELEIKVWRENGALFDKVGETDVLSQLIPASASINTFVVNIPDVLEGDFVGVYVTQGAGSTDRCLWSDPSATGTTYYTTTAAPDVGADFLGGASKVGLIVFEAYMIAPDLVCIGDSITQGATTHTSYLMDTEESNPLDCYPTKIRLATGIVTQNLGIGGQTAEEMNTRFVDVTSAFPQTCIIMAGINDIGGSVPLATFQTHMTDMLDKCIAASIRPFIMLITPWTFGTTLQNQTADTWNTWLLTLPDTYATLEILDVRSDIGETRAGGDAGNLWNLQSEYDADGVHPTPEGYQKIVDVITEGAAYPYPGIDKITWSPGIAYGWININGVQVYNLSNLFGKANTGVTSNTVDWPNTLIVNNATLPEFWTYRHADASGVAVASDYLQLDYIGGYVNNGHEASDVQDSTATKLLDGIVVDGTVYTYDSVSNGKAKYVDGSDYVEWDGSNWTHYTGSLETHLTATGQYPPQTGWPSISIVYSMFGVGSDGTLTELDKAAYDAFPNFTQNTGVQYEEAGANDYVHVKEVVRYKQGTTDGLSEEEYNQADTWSGENTGGAGIKVILRDSSGDIIYDSNGEIIFALPE